MGILHLVFVLLNFRTLRRLYGRVSDASPGVLDQLWQQQSFTRRIDVALGPAVFPKLAMLMNLAVVKPDRLPVHLLGDEHIAKLVRALNARRSASVYRFFCKATGYN